MSFYNFTKNGLIYSLLGLLVLPFFCNSEEGLIPLAIDVCAIFIFLILFLGATIYRDFLFLKEAKKSTPQYHLSKEEIKTELEKIKQKTNDVGGFGGLFITFTFISLVVFCFVVYGIIRPKDREFFNESILVSTVFVILSIIMLVKWYTWKKRLLIKAKNLILPLVNKTKKQLIEKTNDLDEVLNFNPYLNKEEELEKINWEKKNTRTFGIVSLICLFISLLSVFTFVFIFVNSLRHTTDPWDFVFPIFINLIFLAVPITMGVKWHIRKKRTFRKMASLSQNLTEDMEESIEETDFSEETNIPENADPSLILDVWINEVNCENVVSSFVKAHDVLNNILNHPQGMAYLSSSPKGKQTIESMIQVLRNHYESLKNFEEEYLGDFEEKEAPKPENDGIPELTNEELTELEEKNKEPGENEKMTNPSSEAKTILNAWYQLVDFDSFQQSFIQTHEQLDETFVFLKNGEQTKSTSKTRLKVDSMIEMLKLQKYKTEQFEKHYLGEKNKNS